MECRCADAGITAEAGLKVVERLHCSVSMIVYRLYIKSANQINISADQIENGLACSADQIENGLACSADQIENGLACCANQIESGLECCANQIESGLACSAIQQQFVKLFSASTVVV